MATTLDQLSANPEEQAQLSGLDRQRALAKLLLEKGMEQPQGRMVGDRFIAPSPLQHLSGLAQILSGNNMNSSADEQQLALAQAMRGKQQDAIQQYANAQTPAERFAAGTNPNAPQPMQASAYKMLEPQKLGEGETLNQMDMGSGKYIPMATGGEKLSTEEKGYKLAQSQGYKGTFLDYQTGLKRAGANNVSVTLDKGIAAQVGPMMKESVASAQSAVKGIDAANQVIRAIDSNKIITGPLANQRMTAAQIGSTLGVGGQDLQQKVNNTRSAIQGLAELTLQGRQQMHGQGAITESEGALAQRAVSGDISFTASELKQLANAAKRAGDYQYQQHTDKLNVMAQNPETKNLVPYYNVPQMTPIQQPQQPQQPAPTVGGWKVIGAK